MRTAAEALDEHAPLPAVGYGSGFPDNAHADTPCVRTAAEALDEHGFTGEQLLKLSRKAATDALRRAGAHHQ